MPEQVENTIKEERTRRGLSQADLGEVVGVSRQSINAIETGRYIPSLPLALKLARFFDQPVEALFALQEVD